MALPAESERYLILSYDDTWVTPGVADPALYHINSVNLVDKLDWESIQSDQGSPQHDSAATLKRRAATDLSGRLYLYSTYRV